MSYPDEIYVNPRFPGDDVQFGQSIIAPLSGDKTGSYIKTDRTGQMTHYVENINAFPIQDYECMPGRALEVDKNIRMFKNVAKPYNTNDSDAINYNNVDSYGFNLVKSETLINTPTENPPSVTLEFFDYSEIQIDFTSMEVTYIEFKIQTTPTDLSLTPRLYSHDETTDQWSRMTSNINEEIIWDLPGMVQGDAVHTNKVITPVSTGKLRLRMMHTDNGTGAISHKLIYFLAFGTPI